MVVDRAGDRETGRTWTEGNISSPLSTSSRSLASGTWGWMRMNSWTTTHGQSETEVGPQETCFFVLLSGRRVSLRVLKREVSANCSQAGRLAGAYYYEKRDEPVLPARRQ